MKDHHHKLPDRFDPLSPNEQNLSLVLVENGVSERVFLVVVWREVGGQQEGDLGGSYRLVEESDDENAEAVDDEVAGADAVDVHRFQVTATRPLGVFYIQVRLAVVSS